MNYFIFNFIELFTDKSFKVQISKELFSFEDALLRAEDEILLFDTKVNAVNLILREARLETNIIKILW